jgi:tetratricopeptide (TPR) repeat protein
MSAENQPEPKGTCFVVMGFGKKTDFETGRTLDLDKTYRTIIRPSVEAAGLKCIRADDIIHSGPIDVPMYEQLLNADVVVADLSTSNKNAYYELGVRHALRPYTTIIICEDSVKLFPFDINRNLIRQYHHMEKGIDFEEVLRFREVLTSAIREIYSQNPRPNDSPVYTFLNTLTPPALAEAIQGVAEAAAKSAPAADGESDGGADAENAKLYSELIEEVDEAQKAGNFEEAKTLLKLLRKKMKPKKSETPELPEPPEDPYIIQRLALITYKAKRDTPEEVAALKEARELLVELNPQTSNDTETLGLWGAVHKRLWDKAKDATALDEAVRGYERGFYLRNDYYNGINFAFLLNVRAAHAAGLAKTSVVPAEATLHWAEAIADFVQAKRVREEVLSICDQWLVSNPAPDEKTSAEAKEEYLNNKYWVVATKAEAYLGMGKTAEAEKAYEETYSFAPAPWMCDSTKGQRATLEKLLADSPLKYVKADGEETG